MSSVTNEYQRLQEISPLLPDKITKNILWNKKKVMSSARKYKTKISWQLNDPKAYNAARRLKIYNKATKHMHSAEGAKRGSDGRFKKSLRTYSV